MVLNYEPGRGWPLAGLLNLPGAEAAGTDVDIAGSSLDEDVDSLSIRELSALAHIVGVANLVGYLWALVTDLTPMLVPGHPGLLPISGVADPWAQEILMKAP